MGNVLLIENLATDFYSARLPFARYLMTKGWKVFALIPFDSQYSKLIQLEGIHVLDYELNRRDKGIRQLLSLLVMYRKLLLKYEFQVIHSFRFQPNLINVLVGRKNKKIIHITGLGIAFSNPGFKFRLYRFASQIIYILKFFLTSKVIVQNPDDVKDIWASKLFKNKIKIVLGSGIDVNIFSSQNYNKKSIRDGLGIRDNEILFICVSRLIWEKGIKELCEAFQIEHKNNSNIILYIVGWSDFENPRHVPIDFLTSLSDDSGIHFLGKRSDISDLLAASDVFILPSYYREGIPRSLLEALSMGLPIITTDMPGCRLTVTTENGILIKPKSVNEIRNSLVAIINKDFVGMGRVSRKLASKNFSNKVIFEEIESIYNVIC